jgi:hypothetical protein
MSESSSASPADQLRAAENLFMAGQFCAAGGCFAGIAASTKDDYRVMHRLGELGLLENRLDDAIHWLGRAAKVGGGAEPLLAEAYYRARRYPEAAQCYAQLGQTAMAQHLAAFKQHEPYRLHAGPSISILEFLTREPLPLVRVLVNGVEEALFVFDTGTWDTVLDVALAQRIGLPRGWQGHVSCADGRDARVEYSRLSCLTLGEMELADLPVQVMDLGNAMAGFFEPHGVDGVLGLGVLSRFGVELDMPAGQLRLYRDAAEVTASTPCWLGTGRQLLAWGEINQQPNLWFVDTGMTGFDCLLPGTTAAVAQLTRDNQHAIGYGGGGQVALATARVDTLLLDDLHKTPARAVISPAFALERRYGFRIGGLLAMEFLKQAVLALDLSSMRLAVRTASLA